VCTYEFGRSGRPTLQWSSSALATATGSTLLALTLCTVWTIRRRGPRHAELAPHRGAAASSRTLSTRLLGSGDPIFVLLHGLAGSGDYFSGTFDELDRTGTLS
jgi:predicted alpha/beta-fold hydrolase